MKTLTPGLKAHIAGTVTTMAVCWRIVRMDGAVFAFCSFDEDLVVNGITYISTAGFSRTAIATGSTGEVDNLEVTGYFTASGLVEEELKNGLFDYATVYLFMVNWTNLSQGICRLRRGWLGECVRSPSGGFQAELRGLIQALVQEFGNVYQPMCRADLGDAACKMPIKPPRWSSGTTYNNGDYVQALVQSTDPLLVAIFQAQNTGTSDSVEPTWDTTIGNSTTDHDITWLSQPFWRGVSTVTGLIDPHNFVAGALSLPAASVTGSNTAVLSLRDNISGNTTITITDGVNAEIGTDFGPYDLRGNNIVDQLMVRLTTAIGNGSLHMTATQDGALTIRLVNLSGGVGDITKTGDRLRGIVIQNFAAPILDGGVLTWVTGQNAGRSVELKTYNQDSNTVTLWLGMYYPITVGDKFLFYAGCDKRRDTCNQTFKNILNFRAEPDMPNMDAYLSYPDI